MKQLFAWQKRVLERAKGMAFFCIDAACGTGKTLAAIAVAFAKGLPVIVIAPGHDLCNQWKETLEENGVEAEDIWMYTPDRTREEAFSTWLRS
jgi:superfamily II DNA or RNA helicase